MSMNQRLHRTVLTGLGTVLCNIYSLLTLTRMEGAMYFG